MSDPLDDVEPDTIFGALSDPDSALDPEPFAPGSTPDKFRVKRTELLEAIDDCELAYMLDSTNVFTFVSEVQRNSQPLKGCATL